MYRNIFPSCNRQLHRWFFIEYATPTGRIFVTVRNSQPVTCTDTDSETKPLCLDSDWKGHEWCFWHQIINREGDQWRSDYKLWYLARSYWYEINGFLVMKEKDSFNMKYSLPAGLFRNVHRRSLPMCANGWLVGFSHKCRIHQIYTKRLKIWK